MKTALLNKFQHLLPTSYKTLSTNFVYISFFRVVSILIGMTTTYFLARSLSKDDFGNYQFILNIIGICWIFTLPGMQNAIMQDTSRENGHAYKRASDLTFLCSILGSMVLIGCSVFYTLAGQSLLPAAFIIAAALFPFFKGLQHWRGIKLGQEDILGLYTNEGVTSIITGALMVLTIYLFPGSLLAPLLIVLLIPSLQNIIMSLRERWRLNAPEYNHDYIRYGFKTSYHLAVAILSQHLDKILIFTFFSPASLAIYVAANRFAEIARDTMQDVITVITPRLAKMGIYTPKLHSIFRITAVSYGVILTFISFAILPWLIPFIFGEQYRESIPYAQALMMANAIGTFPNLQYRYIRSQLDEQAHKETSLYLALTQIAISVALIPTFGLYGVVAATFCNKFALTFYVRRIIKKRKNLQV